MSEQTNNQVFYRYNSLVKEIARDPLSADLLFTLFAETLDTNFFDHKTPQPKEKTLKEIVENMPPMQQLASYSSDEDLIKAIGTDAADILRFSILESRMAYVSIPEQHEITSLRRQKQTDDQPKCFQFKVIESLPGKEQIFQIIKSKFNNDSFYLWFGSQPERMYWINQNDILNMGKNSAEGIYLSPESLTNPRPVDNKYPNSQLGKKIEITTLCEVVKLPYNEDVEVEIEENYEKKKLTGKLENHGWCFTLSLEKACIIRYLFVNLDVKVNAFRDKAIIDQLK